MSTIRILMTRRECGRLIGVGGPNIQKLRLKTSCFISTDKDTGGDRTVSVRGELINAIETLDFIADSIDLILSNLSLLSFWYLMPLISTPALIRPAFLEFSYCVYYNGNISKLTTVGSKSVGTLC